MVNLRAVRRHFAVRAVLLVLVALLGSFLAVRLAGAVRHEVGPVDTRFELSPSLTGGTHVSVPPLGTLRMSDHAGLRLDVRTTQVHIDQARQLLTNPHQLDELPTKAADDVRHALLTLAIRSAIAAVVGAFLLGAVVYRRWRPAALAAGIALVVTAGAFGLGVATFDERRLSEPHYTGLLADAPSLVGDARHIVANFDVYSQQLAHLTENVTRLYDTTSDLKAYQPDPSTVRVLHVSDIHNNPQAFDLIQSVVQQFKVDVIVDSGDLTDWGSKFETQQASRIGALKIPYVYVRGNHDSLAVQHAVARQPNAVVLDGDAKVVDGMYIFGQGDPLFTPDKRRQSDSSSDEEVLKAAGKQAAERAKRYGKLDIAVIHDPVMAEELMGTASVVLAGHLHERKTEMRDGSLLQVEGSTGGAGLRGLEGDKPTPLTCTLLYFDQDTQRFQAYDEITVGGLGTSSVQISRHLIPRGQAGVTAGP